MVFSQTIPDLFTPGIVPSTRWVGVPYWHVARPRLVDEVSAIGEVVHLVTERTNRAFSRNTPTIALGKSVGPRTLLGSSFD
jgi:hypothetical protein